MLSQIRSALLASCLLVLSASNGAAQTQSGQVLAGRVSDELGGVLVGAEIQVTGLAGERLATATSDLEGLFRIALPTGEGFQVTVHHDAFADATLTVTPAQLERGEVVEVVLPVAGFIERVSVEAAPRDQAFAAQSPQNPYRVPLSAATISQVLTASQIQALKPVSVFDL